MLCMASEYYILHGFSIFFLIVCLLHTSLQKCDTTLDVLLQLRQHSYIFFIMCISILKFMFFGVRTLQVVIISSLFH